MEKIKKINGISLGRFPNALHVEFHERMNALFSADSPGREKINVSAGIMQEYGDHIFTEVDLNRETRASAITLQLEQYDRERDDLISYLFGQINNAQKAPIAAHKAAYQALRPVVRNYIGLATEPVDEETAHIRGLVTDLKKDENAAHIATLGLTDTVTALEAKNVEYSTLRASRTETRADNKKEDLKTVRRRTDDCYDRICECIYASLLLCKTEEDRPTIEKLIDTMNQTIAEFKATYNMSKPNPKDKNEE